MIIYFNDISTSIRYPVTMCDSPNYKFPRKVIVRELYNCYFNA